jgi:hypothetical protein
VNDSTIENAIDVTTGTGDNHADGTIITGDSASTGNVFNQINSSLIGSGNMSLLFRVHGTWTGSVFGAPAGLERIQGPDGSMYLYFPGAGGTASSGSTQLNATSTALIRNGASVSATTGGNSILDAGSALISTGNAYAGANVVNIANTSVIGRNWMLAIVNIFGDFEGNIAFGRPDLWVGEQVAVPSRIGNGSELTYTFSVINNGDSESTSATLVEEYDAAHLEILDSSLAYETDNAGTLTWQLGTIPAGQATEITYRARVKNTDDGTEITNVVRVRSTETDNNESDNTDTATIVTSSRGGQSVRAEREEQKEEVREEAVIEETNVKLALERTTTTQTLADGTRRAHQEITVRNESDNTARGVVLHDLLYAPDGTILRDEPWDIGIMLPGEEVTVAYDADFASDAPAGTYPLSSVLSAYGTATRTYTNGAIVLTEGAALLGTTDNAVVPTVTETPGSVLGAFIEALTPQTANAAEGSQPGGSERTSVLWLIPLILFALIAVGYTLRSLVAPRKR